MARLGSFALVLALAVAAAGCAQIFGLSETTAGADAGSAGSGASLSIDRVSVGASVVTGPMDLTGQTADYLILQPDGTTFVRMPATLAASHSEWTAPLTAAAPVEFTLPTATPYPNFWDIGVANLTGSFVAYEHPNPTAAPAGGAFDTTITLPSAYAAGESFVMKAIGPWGTHTLTAAELPAVTGGTTIGPNTIAFDSSAFTQLVGQPLAALTSSDQLVVLRYVTYQLTASANVPRFTQSGGADPVNVTLATTALAPLAVQVTPAAPGPRMAMAMPAIANPSQSWEVDATPNAANGDPNGVRLNAAVLADTDSGAITAPTGNPFTSLGWSPLITWGAQAARVYTPASTGLPLTLPGGVFVRDAVSSGLSMTMSAGMPTLVSIDATPLSTDGLTVTIDPAGSTVLSMTTDMPQNTLYAWDVLEVTAGAMGATSSSTSLAYVAVSRQPMVRVPGSAFTTGKTYTIEALAFDGGFSRIAMGDLQTRTLPNATGYLYSGVFTVAAP